MFFGKGAEVGRVLVEGKRLTSVPKVSREQILGGLNISKSDLVLEVGSGDNPVPRSDVLSDKCLAYTPDREGREIHIDRRPFIVFDAHKFPFKDKSFDYIIARQVVEYIDEPAEFLHELMRVGKGGYIEVANGLREVIFDWDARKYVVSINEGGKLVIRRKLGKGPFGDLFRKLKDPYLSEFVNRNWSLFNYMLEWDGEINYTIDEDGIDSVNLSRELNIKFGEYTDREALRDRIKELLRALLALFPAWLKRKVYLAYSLPGRMTSLKSHRPTISLEELLKIMACPVCQGEVRFNNEKTVISCQSCQRVYPCLIRNKKIIPVMLQEEAIK